MEERFKYTYDMTLSLARPGGTFTDEDRQVLTAGANEYNERSIYMANPKKIQILGIGPRYIQLQLSSVRELESPGRGLRTLTSILLQSSECFADRVTPGGQLFRVVDVVASQPDRGDADPAMISDADFLKAMVDYVLERKDNSTACRRKKAAMEKMKEIAAQAGMLKGQP